MCVNFHWADEARGKHYELMKVVQGMPKCGTTLSEKFIWNEDDSQFGIDVPAWVQYMHEADCSDDDCDDYCLSKYGGGFVNGISKHVCYSYDILDSICIVIKYDPLREDYFYHGGCFPDGKTYRMKPAVFGEVYKFNKVEIEVRDYSDPVIQGGEMTNYGYNFGTFWRYISYLFNIILIAAICLLVYVGYKIYMLKKENPQSTLSDRNEDIVGQ